MFLTESCLSCMELRESLLPLKQDNSPGFCRVGRAGAWQAPSAAPPHLPERSRTARAVSRQGGPPGARRAATFSSRLGGEGRGAAPAAPVCPGPRPHVHSGSGRAPAPQCWGLAAQLATCCWVPGGAWARAGCSGGPRGSVPGSASTWPESGSAWPAWAWWGQWAVAGGAQGPHGRVQHTRHGVEGPWVRDEWREPERGQGDVGPAPGGVGLALHQPRSLSP